MADQDPIDPALDDLEAQLEDEDDEEREGRRSRGIISIIIAIVIVIIVLLMLKDCGGSERGGKDDDTRSIIGATENKYEKGYVAIWLRSGQNLRQVLAAAGVPYQGAIDMGDGKWVIAVTPGSEKVTATLLLNHGVWDADLVWNSKSGGMSYELQRGDGAEGSGETSEAYEPLVPAESKGTLTEADLQALGRDASSTPAP